eukprot:366278-Chlamydomonas_euryale.AAC.24
MANQLDLLGDLTDGSGEAEPVANGQPITAGALYATSADSDGSSAVNDAASLAQTSAAADPFAPSGLFGGADMNDGGSEYIDSAVRTTDVPVLAAAHAEDRCVVHDVAAAAIDGLVEAEEHDASPDPQPKAAQHFKAGKDIDLAPEAAGHGLEEGADRSESHAASYSHAAIDSHASAEDAPGEGMQANMEQNKGDQAKATQSCPSEEAPDMDAVEDMHDKSVLPQQMLGEAVAGSRHSKGICAAAEQAEAADGPPAVQGGGVVPAGSDGTVPQATDVPPIELSNDGLSGAAPADALETQASDLCTGIELAQVQEPPHCESSEPGFSEFASIEASPQRSIAAACAVGRATSPATPSEARSASAFADFATPDASPEPQAADSTNMDASPEPRAADSTNMDACFTEADNGDEDDDGFGDFAAPKAGEDDQDEFGDFGDFTSSPAGFPLPADEPLAFSETSPVPAAPPVQAAAVAEDPDWLELPEDQYISALAPAWAALIGAGAMPGDSVRDGEAATLVSDSEAHQHFSGSQEQEWISAHGGIPLVQASCENWEAASAPGATPEALARLLGHVYKPTIRCGTPGAAVEDRSQVNPGKCN